MAKKKKESRFGFASKMFWKAFNGYDAVKQTRYRASRGQKIIRSEELELDHTDRKTLISALLSFKRNNPVVNSISRLRKTDVVGKGIIPQATTTDEGLNKEIDEAWSEFSVNPEVTDCMDMRELQQQMVDSLLFYGDCGLIVLDGQVQLIDGSRIGNPNNAYTSNELDKYQNGVTIDKTGKPTGYTVGNMVNGNLQDFREIPAKDFIQFFRRVTPVQYRGIPELAPVLNTLQDCDEYDRVEMISAKVSASLSVAVKREGSIEYEFANHIENDEQDDQGNLQSFEPGQFHYLNPNEDISVISGNGRPNVDGIQWIQYMLRKVGSTVGIPIEFLLMEIGGSSFSASQGVVLQYQQTVESYQSDLIKVMNKLYRRWLSQKIASKEITLPAGVKPFSVRWQRPAFRWVNKVAQVKADLDYFRLGAMSLDDIVSPFGYTAEDVLKRKAQNLMKAKEIAKEAGLDDNELINPYLTSMSGNLADFIQDDNAVTTT